MHNMYGYSFTIEVTPFSEIEKDLFIDAQVQRKLSLRNANSIEDYIMKGLESDTYKPAFPPLVTSRRKDGVLAVLDGQHRCHGHLQATQMLKNQINELKQIQAKGDLVAGQEKKLERYLGYMEILNSSVIPIMAFENLTVAQEQQIFHDLNHLGRKVSKSLALTFNHTDLYVQLTKLIAELSWLKPYILQDKAMPYLTKDKLFLFSTIYATLKQLFGKDLTEENFDPSREKAETFFRMFIDSLPENAESDDYLYRDGRVVQGAALFVRRMSLLPGVDWVHTFEDGLQKVKFDKTNQFFATIGGALQDAEGAISLGKGTAKGIMAVTKVFEALATRQDAAGNRVNAAYTVAAQSILESENSSADMDDATIENEIRLFLTEHAPAAKMDIRRSIKTKSVVLYSVLNRMIENGDVLMEKKANKAIYRLV